MAMTGTKHDTTVDEKLNKYDLEEMWASLMHLEEKGWWEPTPAWAEDIKAELKSPLVGAAFLMVAYRHVALRAMQKVEERPPCAICN